MSIVSYPEREFNRASISNVDRNIFKGEKYAEGGADITLAALDETISPDRLWKLNSIEMGFNGAVRDYDADIIAGRKVLTHYNDSIWFEVDGYVAQRIILDEGFYTGTTLATELQNQLDANSVFNAAGITFTVTYAAAGTFTIVPSAGTIRYINSNNTQPGNIRPSTAGSLFGLTTDTSLAANVVSDTNIPGLGNSVLNLFNVADAANNYLLVTDDSSANRGPFTIDQALNITTNTAATTLTYKVSYEELL